MLNKNEELKKIQAINKLFLQARMIYDSLPEETKSLIEDYNDEQYTISHCILNGLNASADLANALAIALKD